jgi:hypothetical protein
VCDGDSEMFCGRRMAVVVGAPRSTALRVRSWQVTPGHVSANCREADASDGRGSEGLARDVRSAGFICSSLAGCVPLRPRRDASPARQSRVGVLAHAVRPPRLRAARASGVGVFVSTLSGRAVQVGQLGGVLHRLPGRLHPSVQLAVPLVRAGRPLPPRDHGDCLPAGSTQPRA